MRKSFTSINHKNALIRAAAVVIIAAFVIITQTGCGDKGSAWTLPVTSVYMISQAEKERRYLTEHSKR